MAGGAVQADENVIGSSRVRELERLLGRRIIEAEILKKALELARIKKQTLYLPLWNDSKGGSP